jgi:triacylglycerol lipase
MLKTLSYKKIPHLTLTTLPPPYPDYTYFEGQEFFPFEFRSTAFSLPNAW